ncbi:hypothetical protein Pst134EA_032599 [Puccinia striiformis f. sp. tritici]|uniref:uncharacterized protein n=1 Tax=Puccinia striiformis f. sp. tritici TaxID=168172 RepID=UPI0020072B4F|nr:uncharacterized protein Pst134EA_032599 [Puccinia striiformis f. sp. tritici]KAH9441694.1 hypothetical protein Pst134EA_032599 [Puccinia striiformis f. sp. tritici]
MVYKDAANSKLWRIGSYRGPLKCRPAHLLVLRLRKKSNQKNLGTIKSSNLCTEIIEYSAPDEVTVYNLASIALPTYIVDGKYDFHKLHEGHQGSHTYNLNRIIDINYYPIPEARKSNMRHRPIGIRSTRTC